MPNKVLEFNLTPKDQLPLKILRPIPINGDPWGELSILKGTPWGDLIPVVDGEAFSHATHGYATPLMQVIGPEPQALMRMIPKKFRICSALRKCVMADASKCYPHSKMPECYSPPEVPDDVALAVIIVLWAWKENRYVVVVSGEEFG